MDDGKIRAHLDAFTVLFYICRNVRPHLPLYLKASLAEADDQVFDHIWLPPGAQHLARTFYNVGPLNQKSLQSLVRFGPLAESAGIRCDSKLSAPKSRHIYLVGKFQRIFVFVFAICIEARHKPIPTRVVRIQASGLC
jgi:hypothetical protein